MSGAGNQQERPCIEAIPRTLGSFLSGFALAEGSFMIVSSDRRASWRLAALGGLQRLAGGSGSARPLARETLGCGTMRRAGSGGWYREVDNLSDLAERIVPAFARFPLVGQKAQDLDCFRSAVAILSRGSLSDSDFRTVPALRERMNRGGKRRYSMQGILRDYTPSSPSEQTVR